MSLISLLLKSRTEKYEFLILFYLLHIFKPEHKNIKKLSSGQKKKKLSNEIFRKIVLFYFTRFCPGLLFYVHTYIPKSLNLGKASMTNETSLTSVKRL